MSQPHRLFLRRVLLFSVAALVILLVVRYFVLPTTYGSDDEPDEEEEREGEGEEEKVVQQRRRRAPSPPPPRKKRAATRPAPPASTSVSAAANDDLVELVMAFATVHRKKANYLEQTVRSLLEGLSLSERPRVKLVILNGNSPPSEHQALNALLDQPDIRFWVNEGLIRVVTLPEPYAKLQDESKLKRNFGDSIQRIKWRSKQALDFSTVMRESYRAVPTARYFMQLEDDVITVPGYVTRILEWIRRFDRDDWTMLSFYSPHHTADGQQLPPDQFWGFIGQVFRMSEIPNIAKYFDDNFDDRPVDWLMKDYIVEQRGSIYVHSPSLFQHIGLHSSLDGKTQTSNSPTFEEARRQGS